MCLTVFPGTSRMKAKTDLKVYKCLDYNRAVKKYATPFQFMRVEFDEEGKFKFEMDEAIFKSFKSEFQHRTFVDKGMHAYRVKNSADITAMKFYEHDGTATHYAVIPKGSYYYVGVNNDIVANQMIIFKSKKDFDKYAEENEVKPVK